MQKDNIGFLDYLKKYALEEPNRRLLGDEDGWLTVGQVLFRVEKTAGQLWNLGIRSGDRVALRMSQCAQSAIQLLALQAIGAVAVLCSGRCTVSKTLEQAALPQKIPYILTDERGYWELYRLESAVALDETQSVPYEPGSDPCGPGMVIFTSGSTGKSKGVILSQNNLISNLQASAPLGGYQRDDVALGALPMDHVFGLALLTGAIVLRHCLYLTPGGDLDAVLSVIQSQGITRMNGVPALYLNMAAKRDAYDLHSLRCGFIGGGLCTAAQFEKIEQALEMTLVPVYGMSECVGISCGDAQMPRQLRCNGVGRFYPNNQGMLLREDGTIAAVGEVGEVCVRGPQRMLGYCDEIQTKAVIDEEGYLHTGDLGFLDEQGILHLTGRKKDIIIRNGINLSPGRIEEAMLSISGVERAMVVGIPSQNEGEVPCAMAVSRLPEEKILAGLSRILHKNEIPVGIRIVKSIPYTPSGKPDKVKGKELLELWAKALF